MTRLTAIRMLFLFGTPLFMSTAGRAQTLLGSSVIGSGGTVASAGGTIAAGTIGQAIIGLTSNTNDTARQGFWYTLPRPTSSVREHSLSEPITSVLLLQNQPNPFTDETRIRILLREKKSLTVKLFDLLGREVRTLLAGMYEPGTVDLHIDGHELQSGSYTALLEAGTIRQTITLIVIQ